MVKRKCSQDTWVLSKVTLRSHICRDKNRPFLWGVGGFSEIMQGSGTADSVEQSKGLEDDGC